MSHAKPRKAPPPPASRMVRVMGDLHRAIDLMTGGRTPRAAAHALAVEKGWSRRTADRYVGAALAMLHRDRGAEPMESKRSRLIAMCHAQIERALNLTRVLERDGKVAEYAAPDLRAANQALEMLMRLEGL